MIISLCPNQAGQEFCKLFSLYGFAQVFMFLHVWYALFSNLGFLQICTGMLQYKFTTISWLPFSCRTKGKATD